MALKDTTITLQIVGGETKVLGANDTPAVFPETNPLLFHQRTLSSGTGSARAEKIGLAAFSLTGGASVTLNLTAFAGPYGPVNFTSVKEFVVDVQSTRAADVAEVGDDGTVANPWTSPFAGTNARLRACPGAPVRLPSPLGGYAVGGSNCNLLVRNTNAGTNVCSGNVLLIGEGS